MISPRDEGKIGEDTYPKEWKSLAIKWISKLHEGPQELKDSA